MKTSRAWTPLGASLLPLAGALLWSGYYVREVQPTPAVSDRAVAFIGVNVVLMDSERGVGRSRPGVYRRSG